MVLMDFILLPFIGEKRRLIKPNSRNNAKLEDLKVFLIDWINTTLKQEHIVVKSLEEDLFDGLVLHHLLEHLGSLKLDVDKIALTEKKQRQKLSVILEAVAKCLRLEENQLKWSVESILSKDLLSTLHLLVAIAKHFQPDLAIPANVQVETMTIEVIIVFVFATVDHRILSQAGDAFDELFNHAPDRLDAVKQFADGVILLLLIGQLEGYFLNLRDFFLTPASPTEMLHNVNLALDLLTDGGLLNFSVNSEGESWHTSSLALLMPCSG
uniref:Parvin gamma n=1 Tax=Nothoprocta perdicaria TaxID=30464 RepID=A0A8C6YZ36_NOTPE